MIRLRLTCPSSGLGQGKSKTARAYAERLVLESKTTLWISIQFLRMPVEFGPTLYGGGGNSFFDRDEQR